jgi:hypothetical protein
MAYEGGFTFPLAEGTTSRDPRSKDCMYHPNNWIIEQDFYLWAQRQGFSRFHLYDYNSFYHADGYYDVYHGVLQDHGRGDGSDGKAVNRLTPFISGGTDRDKVSVRGQAFLDWLKQVR